MLQAFSFSGAASAGLATQRGGAWAIFTDPIGFILPVACLTMVQVASLSRFMRGTVLEVSGAGLHSHRPGEGMQSQAGPVSTRHS